MHDHSHIGVRTHSLTHTRAHHSHSLCYGCLFCFAASVHTMRTSSHFVYSHGVAVFSYFVWFSDTYTRTHTHIEIQLLCTGRRFVCVHVCVRACACMLHIHTSNFVSRSIAAYANICVHVCVLCVRVYSLCVGQVNVVVVMVAVVVLVAESTLEVYIYLLNGDFLPHALTVDNASTIALCVRKSSLFLHMYKQYFLSFGCIFSRIPFIYAK